MTSCYDCKSQNFKMLKVNLKWIILKHSPSNRCAIIFQESDNFLPSSKEDICISSGY